MFKIGNVEIKGKVILAPMAGVTSLAYRQFMKPFGVDLVVTEMVSDCGLIYENKKTLDYIKTIEEERPVAIQLFGNDAETIIKAMKICKINNPNFDIFDINLGCPVPKVTKAGSGSALLKNPAKLKDMFTKICAATDKPVTAKIRLGYSEDSINFMENIKALEEAGIAGIGIHARTTSQMYSGKARYELLKDLRDKMCVPLFVSGDIYSLDDAINALEITKADAVMVARGGVGNPRLVRQIHEYFENGNRLPNSTLQENIQFLKEFTDLLILEKGEYRAMSILRGIAPKFLDGFPGMKPYKNMLAQSITTKASLERILDDIR